MEKLCFNLLKENADLKAKIKEIKEVFQKNYMGNDKLQLRVIEKIVGDIK